MALLDRDGAVPLYLQVKAWIEEEIRDGSLRPHRRMPSERVLSERFGISRMTVRQALLELTHEGRLYTRVGKGTFVASPVINQPLHTLQSFTEEMCERGVRPASRIIRCEIGPAPLAAARQLKLGEDSAALLLERVRLADGQPLMVEMASLHFPRMERLLDLDLTTSLYAHLRTDFGITPVSAIQAVEARRARPREVALLEMDEEVPVLAMERTTFDVAQRPFEYVVSVRRGDRYRFVMRLEREGGA